LHKSFAAVLLALHVVAHADILATEPSGDAACAVKSLFYESHSKARPEIGAVAWLLEAA
jgi:hypothetical protein